MKLVSFSPWQHTTTSIPSSTRKNEKEEGTDIVHNLIMSPSFASNNYSPSINSPAKRRKVSNSNKKGIKLSSIPDASEIQPVLSITSNHQSCVLGHHHHTNDSKKKGPDTILRQPSSSSIQGDEANLKLKQVPQWIYNSRPDPTSSFLPQTTTKSTMMNGDARKGTTNQRNIGAVVDPLSRHIFVLQNNNQMIKVWNLDDDVVGPDDDDEHYNGQQQESTTGKKKKKKIVQSVDFDSPVLCMDHIPMKHRQVRRVKIKGTMEYGTSSHAATAASRDDGHDIQGGVTGILSNGQMFVLLICSNPKSSGKCLKLGMHGSITEGNITAHEYVYSVVGLTSSTTNSINDSVSSGQKRKLFNGTQSGRTTNGLRNGVLGELSLTILSKGKNQDTKQKPTRGILTMTKHSVTISSLEAIESEMDVDDFSFAKIGGKYKQKHKIIYLPNCSFVKHATNGKGLKHGKSNELFVTQLDQTHLGVVYAATDKSYHATIVDVKVGDTILAPFPLGRSNSSPCKTVVTDIGGLSTSILAVLSSDSTLSLYDLRRAVKLHQVRVHDVLGIEENGVKYQYKIAANWFTGSICIICNASNGRNISISSARVGVYDSQSVDVVETGRKPFVKGSYNLARIIASSMATANDTVSQSDQKLDLERIASNMSDWMPSTGGKKKKSNLSYEVTVSKIVSLLESYRAADKKTKDEKQQSFLEAFEGMKKQLQTLNPSSPSTKSSMEKKAKYQNTQQASFSLRAIPQPIIDVSISVAISIILTNNKKSEDKSHAMKVLLQCIKSGSVSGRNHFMQAVPRIPRNDDTLRYLLLTMQSYSKNNEDPCCSPLDLISNLLQHCNDGLTEQMLVSMIHFVLCHATEEQFSQHWKESQSSSNSKAWYTDSDMKVLEKRLQMAQIENEKKKNDMDTRKGSGSNEDVQNLVNNLETRLAVSRQLHFIEKIITYSKCNPALLRMALQSGLTQAEGGEIGVLIQALGKILRQAGKEKKDMTTTTTATAKASSSKQNTTATSSSNNQFGESTPNKSTCISQWLSALIDTNLATLMQTSNDKTMQQVQKEVSASIAQTKAILSLKELLCEMDRVLDCKKKESSSGLSSTSKKMEVVSVPLYGIEQLIF